MGILDTPRRDTELVLAVALDLAMCDAVLVLKDGHQKLRSAVVLVTSQLGGLPRKTGGISVRGSVIDGGASAGRRKSSSVGGLFARTSLRKISICSSSHSSSSSSSLIEKQCFPKVMISKTTSFLPPLAVPRF